MEKIFKKTEGDLKFLSGVNWGEIQKKNKNGLVQVFVDFVVVDPLDPTKIIKSGRSFGSGFFINKQGDFITNYHVIENAVRIQIETPSGGNRKFQITDKNVGVCPKCDIALVKFRDESNSLTIIPLELGDSSLETSTQEIMISGYPGVGNRREPELTTITGTITSRTIIGGRFFLQTDAPANPGFSGSAMQNEQGKVIAILSAGNPNLNDVSFGIPINDVKVILDELKQGGTINKPFLGVELSETTDALAGNLQGIYISYIYPKSIADNAGLQTGDILSAIIVNGNDPWLIDRTGQVTVPWAEFVVNLEIVLDRLRSNDAVRLQYYPKDSSQEQRETQINLKIGDPRLIKRVFYSLERPRVLKVEGLVIMQLTRNHI